MPHFKLEVIIQGAIRSFETMVTERILGLFPLCLEKEIHLRQRSITEPQHILNKHRGTCQVGRLCGSFDL